MHLFIRNHTRALAGIALVGALASGAFAEVSPEAGTIGTEFTATFDGDLGKKPKIALEYVASPSKKKAKTPKAKAKVVSVNGGTVTFVIQAAKGGGDFNVGVKGSDEVAGSLTLAAPEVNSLDKATVPAGDELVITGAFFGDDANKRNAPKVFVNGKKAKTLEFSGTSLTIQVHKTTSAGLADVTVQNKVGEDTLVGQLTVTVPPKPIKGPDSLEMKVGGKKVKVKFSKKQPEAVLAVLTVNQLQITMAKVDGKDPRKGIRTRSLTLHFILPDSLENLPLPTTINPVGLAIYQDQMLKGLPPTGSVDLYGANASHNVTLTISSRAGNRISGTFSGTLNKDAGDGPSSVSIQDGKFTVTVQE